MWFHRACLTIAIVTLFQPAALASNFSKLRCEDPDFIKSLNTQMKSWDFGPIAKFQHIIMTRTFRTTASDLTCRTMIGINYEGRHYNVRGWIKVHHLGNDNVSIKFVAD